MLTLKELCECTGASRRAIQGFEKAGLIRATARNKYGHLLYDESVAEKVKRILVYQGFTFTVKEIVDLEKFDGRELLKRLQGKEKVLRQKKKGVDNSLKLLREEMMNIDKKVFDCT